MTTAVLVGRPLTLHDLEDVAVRGRAVALDEGARALVLRARTAVDAITRAGDDGPAVYGVNTGFGALSETRISASDVRALQRNLVRSHSTGIGTDLGLPAVRGIMLLRAQVLALGHSGVRVELIELLLEMLNRGVHPRIPSQGSVGASGDLAPLAHLGLALIGEGEASRDLPPKGGIYDASTHPRAVNSAESLRAAGLAPIVLESKEGLALINGTQYMAAIGTLALLESERLCVAADVTGAMSLEALKGSTRPFDERLQAARPHPGQATVARNLRSLLATSEIAESHRNCNKVQDAYSLRCMPSVHGASRDALAWVRQVLEREVNSVTDNPSVFVGADGEADIISGGNFHGQPLALALDLAAMAVAELANISERRVEQMVFLAAGSGLHSGFMIAQVASASLVSENKVLCHPASVDSIPSSAGKEDHVSMGSVSAKKLDQVVTNTRNALAIELMTAAAGVDQRAPLKPSTGIQAALAVVREKVAPMTEDRPLYRDIVQVAALITSGALTRAVEAKIGKLD